jgi:hypothetical protein
MPEDSAPLSESSPPTASSSPPSRLIVPGRPWLTPWRPGETGNPHGNQAPLRSFATHIRQQTGYGKEIAAFYLAIMRGEPIKMPHKVVRRGKYGKKMIQALYVRPTLDQRIDAAAWLADRGWGKAKETIELTGEATPAQRLELLRRLSEDERAQLRGLLQRALTPPNATSEPVESNTAESVLPIGPTPESDSVEPAPQPPENPS